MEVVVLRRSGGAFVENMTRSRTKEVPASSLQSPRATITQHTLTRRTSGGVTEIVGLGGNRPNLPLRANPETPLRSRRRSGRNTRAAIAEQVDESDLEYIDIDTLSMDSESDSAISSDTFMARRLFPGPLPRVLAGRGRASGAFLEEALQPRIQPASPTTITGREFATSRRPRARTATTPSRLPTTPAVTSSNKRKSSGRAAESSTKRTRFVEQDSSDEDIDKMSFNKVL
ncbi:hypothetical protein LTR78_010140 [Recurvomyces mirabilis]|uniref:Uncharacterized protein n=1 Tax=Recurvomyces mirabilis TaxID=574656 RepID=A0AAE0WIB7_9PEZI|nr:hypothetical protein LTR78_010140 [Recurvomyces mirabilis]KAK5149931.1 hypothetical protein LTS14_010536 [Recurvomyces mirabilis]